MVPTTQRSHPVHGCEWRCWCPDFSHLPHLHRNGLGWFPSPPLPIPNKTSYPPMRASHNQSHCRQSPPHISSTQCLDLPFWWTCSNQRWPPITGGRPQPWRTIWQQYRPHRHDWTMGCSQLPWTTGDQVLYSRYYTMSMPPTSWMPWPPARSATIHLQTPCWTRMNWWTTYMLLLKADRDCRPPNFAPWSPQLN